MKLYIFHDSKNRESEMIEEIKLTLDPNLQDENDVSTHFYGPWLHATNVCSRLVKVGRNMAFVSQILLQSKFIKLYTSYQCSTAIA